jgi:hypothetical protein
MNFFKISYILSEVNEQKLQGKNFGESKISKLGAATNDEDFLLCDNENIDEIISKNSQNIPVLLYEEVLLNNIFQSTRGLIQITSLDILEEDIVKYINIGDVFNKREFLVRKICDSTFSLGSIFDELLKTIHLDGGHVFKTIFTFSWLSIFLSQLFKNDVFDLPFEISFDKKDNDLRINIKCLLRTSLAAPFDQALSGGEKYFFSQSIKKLLEHTNFLFLSEDSKEGVFEIDAIILSSDFKPRVIGHKLPSMYERNKERYNFYSPFLELVNPLSEDDRDKVILKKDYPFEEIEESALYERGKLGLEEIALAIKSQVNYFYSNDELNNDLCRKILSKMGFDNSKISNEEIDALINLVEDHESLETFVGMKNAALEQGGSLLGINDDLVNYVKSLDEVDLVDLNILKKIKEDEIDSFVIDGGVEETEKKTSIKRGLEGTEKNIVIRGESVTDEDEKITVEDYSVGLEETDDDTAVEREDESLDETQVVKSKYQNDFNDSEKRDIEEIRASETEIETKIKGLKEDLTEDIIRISSSGENIDQDRFKILFLENTKKHFSVVNRIAEEAGNDIFKSVASKNIDKGLVAHNPKRFNQKIIDLSSDLKERDLRIIQLEKELRESIEGQRKGLHPDLQRLTEQEENDANKEIRVKNKVINILEKKIESLEKKNVAKLFDLPREDSADIERLKSDLISAQVKAESFKSLLFEMTNRLKKNNQEINEFKNRMNTSFNLEKRLSISLKRSEDARINLKKEKALLSKKINLMKQSTIERTIQDNTDPESLNDRIDSNKARSSLKLLEAKNRHLEAYTAKLKGSLSEMNSQFQISKKESHKYKLQIKLLEQQIKNLIKRSA